jgi:BNR repeat-like domain
MKRTASAIAALGLFLFTQPAQADWSAAKRLTWNSGFSYYPAVAVDASGHLHVVWQDSAPGNYEVYYKKSEDGGATWTTSKRLTWISGASSTPVIAVAPSGTLHVVWVQLLPGNSDVFYKKSDDGGATWAAPKRLTWTAGGSAGSAIAVDPLEGLHVVWHDDTPGNYEIYYRGSTDGGATWTPTKRLTWTSDDSYSPAIATDSSGVVHVVWEDRTPGNYELFYKKSTDGGASWMSNKRLTWTAGWSQFQALTVDSSDHLHLVWDDGAPGEIYYKKSTNGGDTWTASKRLSWNSSYSYAPSIGAESSAKLHMVWHDNMPGNFEIYYKKSTDGGTTWTAAQRLTWNPGESVWTSIAVEASGNVHVVWYDATSGDYEIYYKKYTK